MALVKTDLSCVAQTGAGKVFTYVSTADNIAVVAAPGYFGGVVPDGVVNDGDLCWVKAADSNALLQFTATTNPVNIDLIAVPVA